MKMSTTEQEDGNRKPYKTDRTSEEGKPARVIAKEPPKGEKKNTKKKEAYKG